MKLIGICTKPLSTIAEQLDKHDKNWAYFDTKKSLKTVIENCSSDCIILCPNYFLLKDNIKELSKLKNTVVVFGNLLFLSEIVNINIIDIKQSSNNSAFISKPINYEELFDNDFKQYSIKDYTHLDHTAFLHDLRLKGKFGRLVFGCVNCTSVGENKTEFNRDLYDYLFNHQNIKKLKTKLEVYNTDEYSSKMLGKLFKYFKTNEEFMEVMKFIGNQLQQHKPCNYAKLENKASDIYKYNLKYMVKDYNMILDGKYDKVIG